MVVLKRKKNMATFGRRTIRFIDILSGLFFKANELGCYKTIFHAEAERKRHKGNQNTAPFTRFLPITMCVAGRDV